MEATSSSRREEEEEEEVGRVYPTLRHLLISNPKIEVCGGERTRLAVSFSGSHSHCLMKVLSAFPQISSFNITQTEGLPLSSFWKELMLSCGQSLLLSLSLVEVPLVDECVEQLVGSTLGRWRDESDLPESDLFPYVSQWGCQSGCASSSPVGASLLTALSEPRRPLLRKPCPLQTLSLRPSASKWDRGFGIPAATSLIELILDRELRYGFSFYI